MKKKITLELENTAPLEIAIRRGIIAETNILKMAKERGTVPGLVESCEEYIQVLQACLNAILEAPWENDRSL